MHVYFLCSSIGIFKEGLIAFPIFFLKNKSVYGMWNCVCLCNVNYIINEQRDYSTNEIFVQMAESFFRDSKAPSSVPRLNIVVSI